MGEALGSWSFGKLEIFELKQALLDLRPFRWRTGKELRSVSTFRLCDRGKEMQQTYKNNSLAAKKTLWFPTIC